MQVNGYLFRTESFDYCSCSKLGPWVLVVVGIVPFSKLGPWVLVVAGLGPHPSPPDMNLLVCNAERLCLFFFRFRCNFFFLRLIEII